MISAISSVTGKTVSNNEVLKTSFRSSDMSERKGIDDLSLMPEARDIVSQKNSGLYNFVKSTKKDIDITLAEKKVDMLREKFDSIKEDDIKKVILAGMIEDAEEELETVKIHYNVL